MRSARLSDRERRVRPSVSMGSFFLFDLRQEKSRKKGNILGLFPRLLTLNTQRFYGPFGNFDLKNQFALSQTTGVNVFAWYQSKHSDPEGQ